jgi:hypothetical protein
MPIGESMEIAVSRHNSVGLGYTNDHTHKEKVTPVDPQQILNALLSVPLYESEETEDVSSVGWIIYSDQALKEEITPVDPQQILDALLSVPLYESEEIS